MSDPTEEGNKTVFRPSPLQGRKTGQTNFPGQHGATTPGIVAPPVPQQPVWSTPAAAPASRPLPDDAPGTTALAPARAGGSPLPFSSPAGERSQEGPVSGQPAAPRTAPASAKAGGARTVQSPPARGGAGATVMKIVVAVLILCLLAFLAATLLRPDVIPAQLRLSDGGIRTVGPSTPGQARA